MLDYQVGSIFATASATFIARDNIKIDRDAYYTTTVHLSNEVGEGVGNYAVERAKTDGAE